MIAASPREGGRSGPGRGQVEFISLTSTLTLRPTLREPLLTFLAATALASGLFYARPNRSARAPQPARPHRRRVFLRPGRGGSGDRASFRFSAGWSAPGPDSHERGGSVAGDCRDVSLFIVGFFLFYGVVCGPLSVGDGVGQFLGRLCPGPVWLGWSGGHFRLPPDFALLAANQVLVIALPEEMFFRGYLLGRLEACWPSRRRLGGALVGPALLVSAVLFALGHFLVDFNPQRLAVFFPALVFGWMRARTGSVAAGTAFHALCNLLADVLHMSYF